MTEDEFAAYQSLSEETGDHRWAFGSGFTDPLEGIDASVPDGVDAAVRSGLARAAQTMRGLDWFEVESVRGHLGDAASGEPDDDPATAVGAGLRADRNE